LWLNFAPTGFKIWQRSSFFCPFDRHQAFSDSRGAQFVTSDDAAMGLASLQAQISATTPDTASPAARVPDAHMYGTPSSDGRPSSASWFDKSLEKHRVENQIRSVSGLGLEQALCKLNGDDSVVMFLKNVQFVTALSNAVFVSIFAL